MYLTAQEEKECKKHIESLDNHTSHWINFNSGDDYYNTVIKTSIGASVKDIRILMNNLVNDDSAKIGVDKEPNYIIPPSTFAKAKNKDNSNHTILCEYKGNVVYIGNTDKVICSNENTIGNYTTLQKLFGSTITVISPNEAILLVIDEASSVHRNNITHRTTINRLEKEIDKVKGKYRKCKNKVKKAKKLAQQIIIDAINATPTSTP